MENKRALEIEVALLQAGLDVVDVVSIKYGQQIKLGCGLCVNVYKNGTIMVQGRPELSTIKKTMRLLSIALPPETKWHIR